MIIFRANVHILFGLSITLLIVECLNNFIFKIRLGFEEYIMLILGCVFGSMFPDCDIRYSPGALIFPLWYFLEKYAMKYRTKELEIKAERFNTTVEYQVIRYYHRKFTHNIWFMLSMFVPLYFLGYWGLGFFLGTNLHIVLDSFTKSGIPLFIGINNRYYGFKKINSNSIKATVAINLLSVLQLLYITFLKI